MKKIFYAVLAYSFFLPKLVFGQQGGDTNSGEGTLASFKLTNPLKIKDDATLIDLLNMLVDGILYLAIPVIVILLIYNGLLFVLARGNPKKIDDARSMFFYIIVGTVIILGSKLIIAIIENTLQAFSAI